MPLADVRFFMSDDELLFCLGVFLAVVPKQILEKGAGRNLAFCGD